MKYLINKLKKDNKLVFNVKVKTNAPKSRYIETMADGTLKLEIAAVPEKGKANKELIRFLAKEFNINQNNVTIIAGIKNQRKTIKIKTT